MSTKDNFIQSIVDEMTLTEKLAKWYNMEK